MCLIVTTISIEVGNKFHSEYQIVTTIKIQPLLKINIAIKLIFVTYKQFKKKKNTHQKKKNTPKNPITRRALFK